MSQKPCSCDSKRLSEDGGIIHGRFDYDYNFPTSFLPTNTPPPIFLHDDHINAYDEHGPPLFFNLITNCAIIDFIFTSQPPCTTAHLDRIGISRLFFVLGWTLRAKIIGVQFEQRRYGRILFVHAVPPSLSLSPTPHTPHLFHPPSWDTNRCLIPLRLVGRLRRVCSFQPTAALRELLSFARAGREEILRKQNSKESASRSRDFFMPPFVMG